MEIPKLLFRVKTPSRTEKDESGDPILRTIEVYDTGMVLCDCPAKESILCHHGQIVLQKLEETIPKIKAKYGK